MAETEWVPSEDAIEAACKIFVDSEAKDGKTFPWARCSDDLRNDYRQYMRPALQAAHLLSTAPAPPVGMTERSCEFVNEFGNKISISLAMGFPVDGVQRMILRICGPKSVSENTITEVELAELSRVLAAPPVAGETRTPEQRAIEFGEYMAEAAINYMEMAGERFPDPDTLSDRFKALGSAVYEFRKRATKATSSNVPSVSPHSFAAGIAAAKKCDERAAEERGDAEKWRKDGMQKTAAIAGEHAAALMHAAAAIRALSPSPPTEAAPEKDDGLQAIRDSIRKGARRSDHRFRLENPSKEISASPNDINGLTPNSAAEEITPETERLRKALEACRDCLAFGVTREEEARALELADTALARSALHPNPTTTG